MRRLLYLVESSGKDVAETAAA